MARKKPTVKEQRADQRAMKLRAEQEKQARERRNRWVILGIAVAVAVAMLAWPVVNAIRDAADEPSANGETIEGLATSTPSQGHVITPVDYEQDPPAGGEHDPAWLNCGVYTEPVRSENAVHAQEHGAVWVTYQPDLPAEDVEALTDAMPDTYVLLSPYPGLEDPVVVSAWGAQVKLDGPDDPRLETFIREYREGGTAPEVGAPCTGGVDETGQPG